MSNKINSKEWRRFNLYDEDLFIIDSGNKLDKSKMSSINPQINFVSRSNNNNGISCIVDRIDNITPYKAGNMTIALGGEYLGSCFIQEKDFYTSQNVNVLIPRWNMSNYIKRFIAIILFKESRTYYKAFEDELNRHMNTDFSILLPIDKVGKPDWNYMENYMKVIEKKSQERIDKFLSIKETKNFIDTSNWNNFRIEELFITNLKGKKKQVPTGASVAKKDLFIGDIPRITVTNINNGISGYYSLENQNKDYRIYEDFISVSFLGTIFYHPYKATLDMKVHCLQLKDDKLRKNQYIHLFLITALKASLKNCDYADQISSTLLSELFIKLPVTKLDIPDWNYMENYIKLIEEKTKKRINILQELKNKNL